MKSLSDRRWILILITILLGLVVACTPFIRAKLLTPQHFTGPWVHGPAQARWTIIEYADLECPFCKTYTPVLKAWVEGQKDVNLQWHHLPLEIHGRRARQEAIQVECAGKLGGAASFWQAVDQTFARTHSNGQGFDGSIEIAGIDHQDLESCSTNDIQVAMHIDRQYQDAVAAGINATPSMIIQDNKTGRTIKLEGPADGLTLLSAIDWLAQQAKHYK
ncbi:DsbA family protein [Pseudomonas chlororaphis]|uniref:DsbA family protein n=1 Tax=Pseudomonas chlororaphis subsp. aurantiaca TaxID=86192 RepID=A0AAJ1E2R0_9PSED|nr:DsbA family protein [Pseudomonas chlororaphis]MBU4634042.1 DsbA family protein [Pseudomonas chlororaphis subsp. aurantiaca]